MTGKEIRARFLKYFEERGHVVVPSSGLFPKNDPTLMFTNAGMNQFKDCFLGLEDRGYYRAASSQKCVRAGGKHNDLENVGRTARHHTFFEMLGNFSFGDYFKKEAIAFAWEFLTGRAEARQEPAVCDGLYRRRRSRRHLAPAGRGAARADLPLRREGQLLVHGRYRSLRSLHRDLLGQRPGCRLRLPDCAVGCDCDRYMEIWNNVFMQFNRSADGVLTPLPKPSVDTGMGLERITTVMQGVHSNYDTDLLQGIIRHIEKLTRQEVSARTRRTTSPCGSLPTTARAVTFLICDGALPSNEGRGYVLRRIMRRAARHAKMLGVAEPLLYRMVDAVREMMGDAYPELAGARGVHQEGDPGRRGTLRRDPGPWPRDSQ